MSEEVEPIEAVLERVSEFACVVGLRPHALVRQEGRTLAIADLNRLMEAASALSRLEQERDEARKEYLNASKDCADLAAQVEALHKALERAAQLVATIEQAVDGAFVIDCPDPELEVVEADEIIRAALAGSSAKSSADAEGEA